MHDIRQELQALDVSRPALRRFGLTVGAVFVLIAAYLVYRSGGTLTLGARVTGGLGTALVIGGLVMPGVLRPVFKAWMAAAFSMGFVMTRVLLSLVFFLLVTPIGVVRRLLGRDPMRTRPADTYWIRREAAPDRESMTRAW